VEKMGKRLTLIDSLRGLSLFGILVSNMLIFQYGIYGKEKIEFYHLHTFDEAMYIFSKIFFETSFLPIFLFLFGYSIILLRNKLEENGKRIKWHLFRRFLLLIMFGILHSIFVWEGDILLTYGFLGIVTLMFVNRKPKTILYWIIGIYAMVILFVIFSSFFLEETAEEDNEQINAYIQKEYDTYSTGSYAEIFNFRMNEEPPENFSDVEYFIIFLLMLFMTCPILLLGMYAAKCGWFTNPFLNKRKYGIIAAFLIPLGLILKSIPYLFKDLSFGDAAYSIGGPVLAFGYIFIFSYFYCGEGQKYLTYFKSIGRLSMTNYLFQSLICTTIFYGYGLALFGKLGVFTGIILAVVIFQCQAFISRLYLKKWKTGPFEKLMRIGTYLSWNGKVKPNTKKVENFDRNIEITP